MYIRAFAKAIPQWHVDAKKIAEWTGGEEAFIAGKIGILDRHFLGPDETVTSLATQAVRNLQKSEAEFKLETVDFLVLVTQNPDYRIPHTSAQLQSELGIPSTCAAFDISLGCSGWVYALSVVKGMMASEGLQNALLVTCDPYSKIMSRGDKGTVSVFGDAASATWMSSERGAQIGRADFGTDGSLGHNLILEAGGSRQPTMSLTDETPRGHEQAKASLHMNGRAILEFMLTRVPVSIDACLVKNKLSREDVDLYVFHQASAFLLEHLRREMGLTKEKVPSNLAHLGNTVSSTIPLLLEELNADRKLSGKRVLVSGFGVGLSWASNILTF